MATNNKDFVVKQGIKVATGVIFPDNSVQTTAYTGSPSMSVYSSDPENPVNGQQYLNSITKRVKIYYDGSWYTQAFYDDTALVQNHTHDEGGFVQDIYQYAGAESAVLPALMGTSLDGGTASSTYTLTIDGGTAA